MSARNPFPLDVVLPHRPSVQQYIHQMVIQEIHLVHVENAAIGGRKKARLEYPLAVFYRSLQIEGTDNPVFSGPNG